MRPAEIPLALNFGMARASVGSGGSLVNMYAEEAPTGAKATTRLIGVPGRREWVQLQYLNDDNELTDETNVNAMIFAFSKIVVVGEHAIFLVSEDGSWTRLSNTDGMASPVSVAFNSIDVAAVNGTDGVWINESGVTSIESADADFEPADTVAFLDSFMVFNRTGTGQVFCTDSYSRSINALDFSTAEKAPDNAVGVLAVGDNLVIFGTDTTEAWYNAGLQRLPFERIPGAVISHGCASMATAREFDGTAFWLTPGGLVMMSIGLAPRRISDGEIETALRDVKTRGEAEIPSVDYWATARAYIFSHAGHTFYRLTVGDLTVAYDLATGEWHQISNYSRSSDLARCYVQAWGRHFVGDDQGRILEMAPDAYDDAGEPLIAEIVSMPYHNDRLYSSFGSLELQMDTGWSPFEREFKVDMAVSSDGGRSWGFERSASIGRRGQYKPPVQWRKLGARVDHRYRFRISDPFPRVVLATAYMRA